MGHAADTILHEVTVLHEIRARLASAGVEMRPATDLFKLDRCLEHIGDPDLVVDAVLMVPRPVWLSRIIGFDLMLPHQDKAA